MLTEDALDAPADLALNLLQANPGQNASAPGMWEMSSTSRTIISAQAGPQTAFLQSSADICVYGGAAGGGKTVGLILEPMRHATRVRDFSAVFFRRTKPNWAVGSVEWQREAEKRRAERAAASAQTS